MSGSSTAERPAGRRASAGSNPAPAIAANAAEENRMTTIPIEIENVGPVAEFEADLSPGVTVLRGRHGCGKTTILRTVQLGVGGKPDRKPAKSDGTPRGSATIAGKTLSITRVVREEGELTVDGLGELSLNELQGPRFDDPIVRDKRRINCLVRLAGVPADPSLFHECAGGREPFDVLVGADAVKSDDLVEMAARIKRRFEKHAQDHEAKASTHGERHAAERQQAEGVDVSAPDDAVELGGALQDAIAARAKIVEQVAAAGRAARLAGEARIRRDELPEPRSIAALQINVENAVRECQDAIAAVELARAALSEAEKRQTAAQYAKRFADETLSQALQENTIRDELDRTIAVAADIDCPSDADVFYAEKAVADAQAAIDRGARVRLAKQALTLAEEQAQLAKQAEQAAKSMRAAAAETGSVLSNAIARIPGCPLRVAYDDDGNARLVTKTDRSESELFDDLSDGQRWRLSIEIAAAHGKLLVLDQAAWGELSDGTRTQIDAMARERGCYILTAQADDGELRAQAWNAAEAVAA